jgi:CRP-like cAMP-binding protein
MTPTGVASDTLARFVPLDTLSRVSLGRLAARVSPELLRPGDIVFRRGSLDRSHVFLLRGTLELVRDHLAHSIITAGSEASMRPIAHRQPRAHTVRARTETEIVRIDSQELDMLLTWDHSRGYDVEDVEDVDEPLEADADWMIQLLRAPLFRNIPPAHIQTLFASLEPVTVSAGEYVLRQGEPGEYFYVVRDGRCEILRSTPLRPAGVHVAELGPGETFGEEALIASGPRSASVVMRSPGRLMRLAKRDFLALLRQPVMRELDYRAASQRVHEGTASWLDVRMPSEHQSCHLEGDQNLPLIILRMRAKGLDHDREYIVYCDTGRRSAVGVYVLAERGLHASLLQGGLSEVPASALQHESNG